MSIEPAGTDAPPTDDAQLLSELTRALRVERRRAPGDFFAILCVGIAATAVVLLAGATLAGPGLGQDLLLNMSTEVLGAFVTVVIIGGLWQQLQRFALGEVDHLSANVSARRANGLTTAERQACRRIIEVHRTTAESPPVIRQARAFVFALRHRSELRAIEALLGPEDSAAGSNTQRA